MREGRRRKSQRSTPLELLESRRLLCFLPHADTATSQSDSIAKIESPTQSSPDSSATTLFSWQTGANIPQARFEAQGAVVSGKLYVLGGFFNDAIQATRRSDVYNPATNMWTQIADMPEALTHAGQAVDGDLLYLAGGFLGNHPGGSVDFVRIYNTSANMWTSGPSLPDDRGGGALVRLGRELHYFGGGTRQAGNPNITDFGTHWVLDLGPTASTSDDATSWTTAPGMPNPRNHIGGAAAGGKIYAIGGQHGEDEINGNQSSVHVYDPASGWSSAAELPRPLGHTSSSTFTYNGRIVVAGGVTQNSTEVANVIEYDPATNTWVALPSLPAPRQSPVAGVVGSKLIVSTGHSNGIHGTTWSGMLEETWEAATTGIAAMPLALGEVAAGIIGKMLYVVGEGNSATLAYNLSTNQWSPAGALATRQFAGNHHAAEIINGKLYLFGGLGSSSGGKVQIYNPTTNQWTLGADMPFAAGSSSSAVINGEAYVAGGIIGTSTTNQFAKYNPTTNMWTSLPAMPQGRNHTASATDGQKLYIFGGRDGANMVANGFNTVQIYDPATNQWTSSLTPGSTLAPLPQARGGMGKAVWLNGEFFVIGGETLNGPGATPLNVYNRVDIYNPFTNTWRLGTELPTARHGISPLGHAGRIYVTGGGIQAGGSSSALNEIYNPDLAPIVVSSQFEFETAPLRVAIGFSEDVFASLQPADLSVRRLPADPPFAPTSVSYDLGSNTATFTLATPLPDGDYRATLLAANVTDASGRALARDFTFDFFVLAGDANRDRQVNLADFNILAANFGSTGATFSQGNFNYDTIVNLADFNILASRFGAALPPQANPSGFSQQPIDEDDPLSETLA